MKKERMSDALKQRERRARLKAAGLCTKCGKERDNTKYLVCNSCRTKPYYLYTKEMHTKRKLAAFTAYGGIICVCCKETNPIFLAIDHIEGGGNKHRKSLYKNGQGFGGNIYTWLAARNYPPGFQVLCHNCNFGKHINGGTCPHQQKSIATWGCQ